MGDDHTWPTVRITPIREDPIVTHILDADGDGKGDLAPDTAADARQRSLRTLAQGAAAAGCIAAVVVVVTAVSSAHSWADIDWRALSFLVVQALVTAVWSYVGRYLAPPAA